MGVISLFMNLFENCNIINWVDSLYDETIGRSISQQDDGGHSAVEVEVTDVPEYCLP